MAPAAPGADIVSHLLKLKKVSTCQPGLESRRRSASFRGKVPASAFAGRLYKFCSGHACEPLGASRLPLDPDSVPGSSCSKVAGSLDVVAAPSVAGLTSAAVVCAGLPQTTSTTSLQTVHRVSAGPGGLAYRRWSFLDGGGRGGVGGPGLVRFTRGSFHSF